MFAICFGKKVFLAALEQVHTDSVIISFASELSAELNKLDLEINSFLEASK